MSTYKLSQNIWRKYNLKSNPFDTSPLSQDKNTLLPVAEATVGRGFDTKESKLITSILRSPGGARILVTGNIGVGKTTFVNYHRYLWEHHAEDRLFTTQQEISVTEDWRLYHFLVNVIGGMVTKLVYLKGESFLSKRPILRELLAFTKIFYQTNYSLQGSVFGFGGGFGKSETINVPVLPESQLIQYLYEMVIEIKNIGFGGVILHFDNLELFGSGKSQKARAFFEEIRDSIQIPDVYFIFVAKKGFFQEVISPLERVRSIFFGRPVLIPPLSKEQVLKAIDKRYELLKVDRKKVIPPVEDSFVAYLYDLYSGKLRYVMDAMNMIIPEFDESQKTVSSKKAKKCLSHLVQEHLKNNLTRSEWKIFLFCIDKETFTNKNLQEHFGLLGSNVTRFIKRFLDLDLVYLERREGGVSFIKSTSIFVLLKLIR